MAKKKGPATITPKASAPAGGSVSLGGGGVSLGGGIMGLGGGGGVSLTGKVDRRGPITAPMPDMKKRPPGEPLAIEIEDREELEELQQQFADPLLEKAEKSTLTAAEYYEKKRKEQARRTQATEISYWVGLVFANTADLEVFISKLPPDFEFIGQFCDGYDFADAVGIEVPRTNLTDPSGNVLEQWAELALEVPEPPEPGVPTDFDPRFE